MRPVLPAIRAPISQIRSNAKSTARLSHAALSPNAVARHVKRKRSVRAVIVLALVKPPLDGGNRGTQQQSGGDDADDPCIHPRWLEQFGGERNIVPNSRCR